MGCKLKIGDYSFPTETTMVPIAVTAEDDPRGTRIRTREVWRIRTLLQESPGSEANIKTKTAALVAALDNAATATLYQTDGVTSTAHSLSDIKVLAWRFPEPTGPELFSRRTVEVDIEAFATIGSTRVTAFQETYAYSGGGARYTVVGTIEGPPQHFKTQDLSPYYCTQSGSAEVRATPYYAPSARFPAALLQDNPQISYTPRRVAGGELRYITRWTYSYASAAKLSGKPLTWGEA